MAFLIVDESKCKKESICVAECPSKIIKLQEDTGYPDVIPGEDNRCIRCGHCVAVCSEGAVVHPDIPDENCPPIKPELIINEAQAAQKRIRRAERDGSRAPAGADWPQSGAGQPDRLRSVLPLTASQTPAHALASGDTGPLFGSVLGHSAVPQATGTNSGDGTADRSPADHLLGVA